MTKLSLVSEKGHDNWQTRMQSLLLGKPSTGNPLTLTPMEGIATFTAHLPILQSDNLGVSATNFFYF